MNKVSNKHNFKSFLKISYWTIRIFFKMSPINTVISILSVVLAKLDNVIYTFTIAYILKRVEYNFLDTENIWPELLIIGTVLLGTNSIRILSAVVNTYTKSILRQFIKPYLREKLHLNVQNMSISELESPTIANEIQLARENIDIFPYFENSIELFGFIFTAISASIALSIYLPVLVPILVIVAIPKILNIKHHLGEIIKYKKETTEQRRKAKDAMNTTLNPATLLELKITSGSQYLLTIFKEFFDEFNSNWKNLRRKWSQSFFLIRIFEILTQTGGYIYVIHEYLQGSLTSIGDIMLYIGMINIFSHSLGIVANRFSNTYTKSNNYLELYEILNRPLRKNNGNIKLNDLSTSPEIKLKDISFNYPNSKTEVLKNINLSISTGEKIAIVGHNGAGKTTLVKLICKFYEPTNGNVFINNTNLQEINDDSWLRNIGVLFQEYNTYPYLTPTENIYLGKSKKGLEKDGIEKAAKEAHAHEFISKLPKGYNNILGERYKDGVRPSTGQWQRLAVARFFYRDPSLVIFDEPTASIDAQAELEIFNNIYNSFENKTVIIISHRFSTVRNADRIVVLDEGEIVETGSHKELIKQKGKYAELFKLQADGYN